MRAGAVGVFRAIATAGFILLATQAGSAVEVGLQIYADGALIGDVDGSQLGCVDDPGGLSATCHVEDLPYGTDYPLINLDVVDLSLDSDPVVTGTTGVTNLQNFAQHFTLIFTLNVTSMPGGTVTGGRVSGTLTDHNSDGASVYTNGPGSSFYTALLDGADWQKLYTDPQLFNALNGSTTIPQLQFGTPIPSLPGPPVASTIGIRLDFWLTGLDSVSFTSNHVVVPEPGTAGLLGLGLVLLVTRRRGR